MSNHEKTIATLGGKELLASSVVAWSLKEGVAPHIATFDLTPDDALALANIDHPITLEIRPPTGNPTIVQNLWVLNVQPGEHPYISKVTIADRRWMWSYVHILRRYNMRRNIGFKRILASDELAVNFDRAPDIAYWRWSLEFGNRPWLAFNVLEDVLKEIKKAEEDYTGRGITFPFTYAIDYVDLGHRIDDLPIENLEIDDSGDQALNRVLAYLPEAGLYVDYDGTIIIYSRASGKEGDILKSIMPPLWGGGFSDLVQNKRIRPKEIHVLFTREVEVRFNFIENATSVETGTVVIIGNLGESRRMENVLPLPDYQKVVAGLGTICQGTYITMDQAFNAWGAMPGIGRQMDHKFIQRAFVPGMDLWTVTGIIGVIPDPNGNTADWVARISEVRNHYRQTFRINSKWMDRILSIRAYRMATVDPQSGQRAPSRAYGDYCFTYSQKAKMRQSAAGNLLFITNMTAYSQILDKTAKFSPAIVTIPDPDQGIIHVEYNIDPYREREMIFPSQLVVGSIPTVDVTDKQSNITYDSILSQANPPRLSPSFKLAVVVTCIPASPNTDQQLHRIVVKPGDVRHLLPDSQLLGLDDANGPIMEVRIGANIEVARVQWKDDRGDDIEKLFGITPGEPIIDDLVLNRGNISDRKTGGALSAIAIARAAAIYGSLCDRYEGELTGHMNGQTHLGGWIGEVGQELSVNSEPLTHIAFPARIPQFNLLSFLDSNARATILHLAQPEK